MKNNIYKKHVSLYLVKYLKKNYRYMIQLLIERSYSNMISEKIISDLNSINQNDHSLYSAAKYIP